MVENGDEEEILKIRLKDTKINDLLSENFKKALKEKVDENMNAARLILISEEGVIFLSHDNKEASKEGILDLECDSEKTLNEVKEIIKS